jgi:hypothetical protein
MSQKISFPEWVSAEERGGQSKADLSKRLGIELASLYRYLARERVPAKAVMDRIINVSGGQVDVSWFFEATERVAS